jgi:hypothetical protein
MVHLGRHYPFLNRFRVIAAELYWPSWPPTEMAWGVESWEGAEAHLCPTTGRGLLPNMYMVGERSITWAGPIATLTEGLLSWKVELGVRADGLTQFARADLLIAGASCLYFAQEPYGVGALGTWSWEMEMGPTPGGPPAPVEPYAINAFGVVPWSATPKPPKSSPF